METTTGADALRAFLGRIAKLQPGEEIDIDNVEKCNLCKIKPDALIAQCGFDLATAEAISAVMMKEGSIEPLLQAFQLTRKSAPKR